MQPCTLGTFPLEGGWHGRHAGAKYGTVSVGPQRIRTANRTDVCWIDVNPFPCDVTVPVEMQPDPLTSGTDNDHARELVSKDHLAALRAVLAHASDHAQRAENHPRTLMVFPERSIPRPCAITRHGLLIHEGLSIRAITMTTWHERIYSHLNRRCYCAGKREIAWNPLASGPWPGARA